MYQAETQAGMAPRHRKSSRADGTGRDAQAATFDTFLFGPSNELPGGACHAVVASPGGTYNPLFLYGPPGTGKTHLLEATAGGLRARGLDPIEVTTGQQFSENYVRATEADDLPGFRAYMRSVQALFLDDIDRMAGKQRSLEELLHTIDALLEQDRQIMVTARSAPAMLKALPARLRSRLQAGLTAALLLPEQPLRAKLIRDEADRLAWRVPEGVIDLLAERLGGNARQLRGAVARLQMDERLAGRSVTRRAVQRVLADSVEPDPATLLEEITRRVLARYKLRLSQLQSKRRSRSIALPRQICMFLARELTPLSLTEIGAYFGGRDHSTVLHACRKIGQMVADDASVSSVVREIQNDLQQA